MTLVGLSVSVLPPPMLLWDYSMKDGRNISVGIAKPAGSASGAHCPMFPAICRGHPPMKLREVEMERVPGQH